MSPASSRRAINVSTIRKPVLIVIAALVAALCVESAVLAAGLGRNGKTVTAVRTVTNDSLWTPSSATWIDVPDMKTFVTVPSGEKALLVITFSASTSCEAGEVTSSCLVRVLLDGQQVSPGIGWWDQAFPEDVGIKMGARSLQWVAGPVAGGEHQVKVQAEVSGGGMLRMTSMTLTVLRSRM
jgi:hypothetical protein